MVNDRRLNIASQDEVAVKWLFFIIIIKKWINL
jgi:hypothetical protein